MTAGRGIAHAEDSVTEDAGRLHAAQLWIALPEAERQRAPSFHHYPELPIIESGGFRVTVLAGTANGQTAPTEVFSPLVGLDITGLRASPARRRRWSKRPRTGTRGAVPRARTTATLVL